MCKAAVDFRGAVAMASWIMIRPGLRYRNIGDCMGATERNGLRRLT